MQKVLVLGSLNMDLITRVTRTPRIGETVLGNGLLALPGGKGANQAVAIGRLGGNVAMLGMVGEDDYGRSLLENLDKNGVDAARVQIVPEAVSGVALIMVNESGDNSIVVVPGANSLLRPGQISNGDFLGCNFLLAQLETPIDTIEAAFALAKAQGLSTVLNPAPAQTLSKKLLQCTDLLIPNQTEFESLTGVVPLDAAALEKGAAVLFAAGVKQIIVTVGEAGAWYLRPGCVPEHVPAFSVDAIDTTAAGDGFIGGLLYGLCRGEAMKLAMRRGAAVAALAVTRLGAQSSLPTLAEVEDMLEVKDA